MFCEKKTQNIRILEFARRNPRVWSNLFGSNKTPCGRWTAVISLWKMPLFNYPMHGSGYLYTSVRIGISGDLWNYYNLEASRNLWKLISLYPAWTETCIYFTPSFLQGMRYADYTKKIAEDFVSRMISLILFYEIKCTSPPEISYHIYKYVSFIHQGFSKCIVYASNYSRQWWENDKISKVE